MVDETEFDIMDADDESWQEDAMREMFGDESGYETGRLVGITMEVTRMSERSEMNVAVDRLVSCLFVETDGAYFGLPNADGAELEQWR